MSSFVVGFGILFLLLGAIIFIYSLKPRDREVRPGDPQKFQTAINNAFASVVDELVRIQPHLVASYFHDEPLPTRIWRRRRAKNANEHYREQVINLVETLTTLRAGHAELKNAYRHFLSRQRAEDYAAIAVILSRINQDIGTQDKDQKAALTDAELSAILAEFQARESKAKAASRVADNIGKT